MTIIVNENETEVPEGCVVSDLIKSLGLNPERVAVELNRNIIRRSGWDSTRISEGDRVEVVHFVGGGEQIGLIQ